MATMAQKNKYARMPAYAEGAMKMVELGPTNIEDIDPTSKAMAADVHCCLGDGGFGYVFKVRLSNSSSCSFSGINPLKQITSREVALKVFTSKNEVQAPTSKKQFIEQIFIEEIAISLGLSRIASARTPIVRTLHAHTMNKETFRNNLRVLAMGEEQAGEPTKLKPLDIAPNKEEGELLHCMSMELCEGGDLFGLLMEIQQLQSRESGQGLMTEKEAATVLYPLAKAIEFCHNNHILHLDVKPQNVLFKKKGRLETACLGDFSLAMEIPLDKPTVAITSLEETFMSTQAIGTDKFMAPEVATSGIYSPLADVFSLGCVLLYALTGYTFPWSKLSSWPFLNSVFVELTISRYDWHKWEALSPNVKELIKGMLSPNPVHRLNIKQILTHPWLMEHIHLNDRRWGCRHSWASFIQTCRRFGQGISHSIGRQVK